MTVTYLFRSPGTGHSIEALFDSLRHEIEHQRPITAKAIRLPFISRGIRSVWRNLRFVATLKADLFHITGDVHYAALALPARRTVLTIHDCITLKTNRHRPVQYAVFWLLWYYLPIRRAAVVTVVSEKTRQELIQYVGKIATKAIVVPNSYDPAFSYQPTPVRQGPPVLLQIGTAPHKNLSNLILAIEGISCILVIVGPLSTATSDALRNRRITYRNHLNISRDELIQLYIDCNIVTFISIYEGFGMPVLEANAIGRPVITSTRSPMRERAAGAAHLVDPTDVAAIRAGIMRLIHDADYRYQLVDAGRTNVHQYRPAAIADQYATLYDQLQQDQPLPKFYHENCHVG
jgi:glycosyltransferase involved in cell wall biosynthesis